jgi:transcriptional regulator NrdR family protein
MKSYTKSKNSFRSPCCYAPTSVKNSRWRPKLEATMRRRICSKCQKVFTTQEIDK